MEDGPSEILERKCGPNIPSREEVSQYLCQLFSKGGKGGHSKTFELEHSSIKNLT